MTHCFFVDVLRNVQQLLGPDVVARASSSDEKPTSTTLKNLNTKAWKPSAYSKTLKPPTAVRDRPGVSDTESELSPGPQSHSRAGTPVTDGSSTPVHSSTSSPTSVPHEFINPFNCLELETPSETLVPGVDTAIAKQTKSLSIFKAEQVKDKEEAFLAARCFFTDLQAIRKWINSAFKIYDSKKTHLWLISILSDAAHSMIRRAELDFEFDFPDYDLVTFVESVYEGECRKANISKEPPKSPFNFQVYDNMEPYLFPALRILQQFRSMKDPWLRTFDVSLASQSAVVPRTKFSTAQKFEFNLKLIQSIAGDLSFAYQYVPDLKHCDALVQYFGEITQKGRMSISAAFALQTFLDFRWIMQDRFTRGLRELCSHADAMNKNIQRAVTLCEWLSGPSCADMAVQYFEKTTNLIFLDISSDRVYNEKVARKTALSKTDRNMPMALFGNHLTLCGMIALKCRIRLVQDSLKWCNDAKAILKAAHLYNACRMEGYLKREWPAMEKLIALYTPERLFIGNRPGPGDDYWKRCCLASGFSPRYFASDGCECPSKRKLKAHKGARELRFQEAAPILSMLAERFDGNDRAVSSALAELEQNLVHKNVSTTKNPKKQDDARCAGDTLLGELTLAIKDEMEVMLFDYLKLDNECWAMLDTVAEHVQIAFDKVRFEPGINKLGNRGEAPSIVYPILSEASLEKSGARCDCCKTTYFTHGLSLLRDAAKVLNICIVRFDGNQLDSLHCLDLEKNMRFVCKQAFESGARTPEELMKWLDELELDPCCNGVHCVSRQVKEEFQRIHNEEKKNKKQAKSY